MRNMKAIRIHQYGNGEALKLDEVAIPKPGKDEVQIRVKAAGVNPVDWKIRKGYLNDFLHHEFPLTLGWDVAGVVEEVGSDVSLFRPGDEVFGYTSLARNGHYAELGLAKEDEIARKPEQLDFVQAASLPVAALTAWQALFDAADLREGQKVLIHAAAGGVGCMAVQLARWKGALVYGTASPPNADFLMELGVEKVIDYRSQRFESMVSDLDVVLDGVGGETQDRSWPLLRPGGILVAITNPISENLADKHRVRGVNVTVQPSRIQLEEISRLADEERLRPIVNTTFPLDQAFQAHELSQTQHVRGKIVLIPSG